MINWKKIISESGGLRPLCDFTDGKIGYREFENFGQASRRAIRSNGIRRTRQLATKALRRRES